MVVEMKCYEKYVVLRIDGEKSAEKCRTFMQRQHFYEPHLASRLFKCEVNIIGIHKE